MVKHKKQRVVINPGNILPFEVTEEELVYYRQDEYKYLIHYFRAFPEGRVPILQYLLIRFHPLIIKTSGHYYSALNMEWRDLISFTRQKFIELIYRFNLKSSLYFRTYIQTALRRAVYDRVLYECRRKQLFNPVNIDVIYENNQENEESSLILLPDKPTEDYTEILKKLTAFIEESPLLTEQDRQLFNLRFLSNFSIKQTSAKLKLAPFNVIARQRHIRKVLKSFLEKCLI